VMDVDKGPRNFHCFGPKQSVQVLRKWTADQRIKYEYSKENELICEEAEVNENVICTYPQSQLEREFTRAHNSLQGVCNNYSEPPADWSPPAKKARYASNQMITN